jgi:hypothetical protein
MTPAVFPLSLYRGDTYRLQLHTWDDTAKTQPTDLTGVVAKAEIRDQPSGLVIVPLLCTITLPNTIDVVLTAENAKLVPPRGAWDLQLTYLSGDVQTIVAGPVAQTPDITDSTLPVLSLAVRGGQAPARSLRLVSGF